MHACRLALLSLPLVLTAEALAQTGTTRRANVDSAGAQANDSTFGDADLSFSADGRLIAFGSLADNLVPGDTNGDHDVFVHDLSSGVTTCVSVSSSGIQGNNESYPQLSMSEDGRYVAFTSDATNLVPGDTNFLADVFVHDRQTGTTERVSVNVNGQQTITGSSGSPSISGDGRYVAFRSWADDLSLQDTNGWDDIFLRDRLLGLTTLVSIGTGGQQSSSNCGSMDVTTDGRFVVFHSGSAGLVPGNMTSRVFVKDLATGTLELADVDSAGNPATSSHAFPSFPTITDDGRYVSFRSIAPNLVPGDTNGLDDVFVHDRQTGQTTRVSVGTDGTQANGMCLSSSISDSGRWIAFDSQASNLVPGDTNGSLDVFVRDLWLGTTTLVSTGLGGGPSNKDSLSPKLLPDGSRVAFNSNSTDHVVGDTNGATDVFARDLVGCSATVASYCTASGTSIPGCQAQLSAMGTPSLSAPAGFAITSAPHPGGNLGVGYYGVSGPASLPFGSQGGLLCVNPPLLRIGPQSTGGTSGTCSGQMMFTLQNLLTVQPTMIQPGATVHMATWFRDPPSVDGFALSSGLWFTLCP